MNERIQELYIEASEQFKVAQAQGLPMPYQTRAFAEKFAELIVRECEVIARRRLFPNYEGNTNMIAHNNALYCFLSDLYEHFKEEE